MSSPETLGTLEETRSYEEAGIVLYNAGDIRQEFQYAGRFYTFEPRSVTEIKARREQPWTKGRVRAKDKPLVVPEGGDARTIADRILELGQERGICRLMSDGLDDRRTGLAWERYVTYRCARAREIQATWMATVARAGQSPGALPPRQPKKVRDEIAFLADHADGATDRKPWISRIDGFDTATREEMVSYLERNYPAQVQQQGLDALIIQRDHASGGRSVPENKLSNVENLRPKHGVIQARPIAPKDDPLDPASLAAEVPREAPVGEADPMDTRWLLAKARELGVRQTTEELEGIIDGDLLTIEHLTVRLANVQAERSRSARA